MYGVSGARKPGLWQESSVRAAEASCVHAVTFLLMCEYPSPLAARPEFVVTTSFTLGGSVDNYDKSAKESIKKVLAHEHAYAYAYACVYVYV